ncbi:MULTISPECIES: response regulator [unclassified Parafrankia]|uniref:response regulator n=1 Tax=Parafrankia TaxID=2994362 RepID=UPI000DA4EAF6|nr:MULTISPECIES: response regulator [unclassified Parafrankia]TCJ33802.1 response regulator [Parafrankia sp. BMG5.11]CAI7980820.1 Response regulator Rcp1 [Frankia sp. Hr75.2]SQD96255.1 Coupling protein and response regulator for CheA activity in response to attractants (chemotaxis) [Parafrankia sp. Ea1.12]
MTAAAAVRAFNILLVEDDPGDTLMVEEALTDRGVNHELHVAVDGVEAMAYLRDPANPRPDLILLDLNMPRMDGREVLSALKADPRLLSIPVVVLTTSEAPDDVLYSYTLHANAYVSKPVDFEAFTEVIHRIDDFYLGLVRLPRR